MRPYLIVAATIAGLIAAFAAFSQSLPPVPGTQGMYYGFNTDAVFWNTFSKGKQDWAGANPLTVETLPPCAAANQYYWAVVTDATTPTYLGALTGGGSVVVPVFCDGTSWTSH